MSNSITRFLRSILANPTGANGIALPVRERDFQNTLHEVSESGEINVKMRIAVVQAMNGTVLEILRYKHNSNGNDWYATHYIVQEKQKLSDAIAMCLLMKD
jgi:hypothetical protein